MLPSRLIRVSLATAGKIRGGLGTSGKQLSGFRGCCPFAPKIIGHSFPVYVNRTSRSYSTKKQDEKDDDGGGSDDEDAVLPKVVVDRLADIHVMTVGINRPEKRNCVDEETADLLAKAFYDFEHDDSMGCAVLHGFGGNFCAGYDLEKLASIEEEDLSNRLAAMLERGPMGPTRLELSKPVIAAVSGWAVAGGLELALMCDLRVAEDTARLGVLCRRFGVPLIDGGTVRLPELIGLSRALDLILTGRIVEAKEATNIGLVNRLVPTGTAFGKAVNMARELVKFPQKCLRADRASAYYATFASKSLENSLHFEVENAIKVINTESVQGARKFVSGLGKHGKFNVNPTVEKQDWETEFEEITRGKESKKSPQDS